MKRLAAVGVVVVSMLLLLAACGGGSSRLSASDYRAQLEALGKEAAAGQAAAEKGAQTATGVSDFQTTLTTFAAAEQKLGDEVAKLKPPKDADAANTELAGGLHDLADALKAMAPKAAKAASVKAALGLLGKDAGVAKGGQEVDHALAALTKLGYSKGS